MSSERSLNIFIPAAGRGERLRPLTDYIPKPLMPILGKPVLAHVLERVVKLSFNKIGVNLHYKGRMISEWIAGSFYADKIELFHEEKILGTGGALKNAEELLKQSLFLVHNSDVLSNIDLSMIVDHHRKSGNLVTLAVHDHSQFNSLVIDAKDLFVKVDKNAAGKLMAYTGIAVYEPGFLEYLPSGESSVVDAWMTAIHDGHKIGTFDVCGCYWSDIGTAGAYAASIFHSLKEDGETVFIHPTVQGCSDINYKGNVVIEEGAVFQGPVILQNCIVLPNTAAGEKQNLSLFSNCIIGPEVRLNLGPQEVFHSSNVEGKQLIGTGGSDRAYYRINEGDKTFVMMQCRGNDPDYARHIEYTRFFMDCSIPVPSLESYVPDQMQAVFEDVGDISLYSYCRCRRTGQEIKDIYRKVLDIAVGIHSISDERLNNCSLLKERVFDQDYFRWETDYFLDYFIRGIKNMDIDDPQTLSHELDQIAARADSLSKTVIHRDFQSQNIMVMEDRELRVIDFQGARIGPPAYDIASVLWDPYFRFDDSVREELLDYYISSAGNKIGTDFTEALMICRLQRHMQALGAYGFLSRIKGKKNFEKFIPEGIRLLKEDIFITGDLYPELKKLVNGIA